MLAIFASVVLRDTIANYFGGLIVIAAGWFVPKEVIRVLIGGRREISGRVESIGYLYTKLINRAGKVAYIPNSAMVAYKVENLSRAPYREFREQFAISFDDLPKVPHLQTQVESFLRSTVGADVVRGVSLAPRCTLTGMNSFAGGAVLEIVCYNDYGSSARLGLPQCAFVTTFFWVYREYSTKPREIRHRRLHPERRVVIRAPRHVQAARRLGSLERQVW